MLTNGCHRPEARENLVYWYVKCRLDPGKALYYDRKVRVRTLYIRTGVATVLGFRTYIMYESRKGLTELISLHIIINEVSTVPHLAVQSRIFTKCPASREMRQMSHIFLNGIIIFLRCRLFYIFALERNKVTNRARFVLRTPTDAVYISRVAAITSDCLFCYAAGCINTATVTCLGWWILIG